LRAHLGCQLVERLIAKRAGLGPWSNRDNAIARIRYRYDNAASQGVRVATAVSLMVPVMIARWSAISASGSLCEGLVLARFR
jgi:hypothetical protein